MSSLRKLPLLIALASTSVSPFVFADTNLNLDSFVVTGTRSESPLLDLAGNTAKISAKDIDFLNADHIEQVLNRLPGVMIQRGNGQEHLTSIRSPILNGGAGAGSFLYLQDGVPLRAAGFANVNGLFEVNSEQAGSIEVVRGPGSALYGSNAEFGMVNVITKAPSLDLERSIDVSVGPHDLYKTKATVSNTTGNQGYRLSVNGTHDGGWISDSGFDQQKMTFRHDYTGEKDSLKTVFSAANLNQETAAYTEGKDIYKNTGFVKNNNKHPEAYRDAKSARLQVRWDHELGDDASFSLTPYVRYTQMNFLMHFLKGTPLEKNDHKSVGLLANYTRDLEGGHKVIAGTDVEHTYGKLSEVQTDPTNYFHKYTPGVHYNYTVDATVIAPYIHTEWQLLENTRLTAGARFEHTRYKYNNRVSDGLMPGSSLLYRPADSTDTFNNFIPKLGLVQSLAEDTSAFINLAQGKRAPQTTDLYRMRKDSNALIKAKSERLNSIELGVRKVGAGIQYEATTYFMKNKNYFFRDSDDNNVPNGKTRHYGVELSALVPFADQFDLGGSVTYAIHEYDFNHVTSKAATTIKKGTDMDTAPRLLADLHLGWNFMPQSRMELEWMHVGHYNTDQGHLHTYKGHDVFNLRANHKITSALNVYADVTNLFNTDYAERADYNTHTGDRYFVGEQRALHVGASYSF